MWTPVFLALVCLLPGLPLSVALARHRGGRTAFSLVLVDGIVLGLAWYLLVGTLLAHLHRMGVAQVLLPTLAFAAVVAIAQAATPRRWWRGRVASPGTSALAMFVAVTFVVGAALRTKPAYFLYQIGDFGEYVNRGNVLAHRGPFLEWFTHGFSILLALSNLALGQAHTVDVMGFLGLTVMALILAITTRLGATRGARAVLAVVFAIGVVPVWFSNFPASETLYALLLLGMFSMLVTAVQAGHLPTASVAAVLAFLLMLTRGNAVLLIPLLLAIALALAPFVERTTMRVVVTFTASAMAGFAAGFVYNARYSHAYFIAYQMPTFFPEKVWRRFEDVGGLTAAGWKVPVFAVAVAVVLGAGVLLNRWRAPAAVRSLLLPGLLVLAVLSLFTKLQSGGLREGLDHYDGFIHLLGVLAIVGACVVFARRIDEHIRVAILFASVLALAYALLHAYRFKYPNDAPYFLYWDRYLWSEFLPMMMVLAAFGVGLVQEGVRRLRWLRAPASVAVLVVALVGTVTMWRAGSLSREHRFMGDAYADMAEVDHLTGGLPIVFHGVPWRGISLPVAHPNSFRLFAEPLTETFGRQVLNIAGIPSYGEDPMPTPEREVEILQRAGFRKGVVVDVLEDGEPLPGGHLRGVVDVTIPMLNRPRWHQPKAWRFDHFRIAVGDLEVP